MAIKCLYTGNFIAESFFNPILFCLSAKLGKNIYLTCHLLILTFIHRNESSGQKTLNFKNSECFVKENFHLSRERVTVFTQISSD